MAGISITRSDTADAGRIFAMLDKHLRDALNAVADKLEAPVGGDGPELKG